MKLTLKGRERWAKTRQMGRSRYVLWTGVVGWGVTTGVVWALSMAMKEGWSLLPIFLTFALIAFPAGGYFFGRLMWKWNEVCFRQSGA
jgi:hypothetical protein